MEALAGAALLTVLVFLATLPLTTGTLVVLVVELLKLADAHARQVTAKQSESFHALQQRHGGTLVGSSYSPYPALRLSMGSATAYLAYKHIDSERFEGPSTGLYILLPEELPSCKLSLQHDKQWLGQLMGFQDIQLGCPAFDDAFAIKGDPNAMEALLDEPTREAVLAFTSSLPGTVPLQIRIVPQKGAGSLIHIRRDQHYADRNFRRPF